jgi:hypothetical protein
MHNTVFPDTFFVAQITRALSVGNLSNVYRACSFFTISDLFCIDNARYRPENTVIELQSENV